MEVRSEAKRGTPGRNLRFWALVVADKEVATEKGERTQFVTFEDETGLCEAVAFPDAIRKRQRPFRVGEIVCVSGRSTRQDGLAVLEGQGGQGWGSRQRTAVRGECAAPSNWRRRVIVLMGRGECPRVQD